MFDPVLDCRTMSLLRDIKNESKRLFFIFLIGKSGTVVLDGNGNREPFYELRNFQYGVPVHMCTYNVLKQCIGESVRVLWPGGRNGPPKDQPECGFDNELCQGSLYLLHHL